MNRVAERIEDRGNDVGDRRVEPPNVVLGDRDVLGKGAVTVDADDLDALANMRLSGSAEQTREVDDMTLGRDALAGANRTHRLPGRDDRAHELVADDERRFDSLLRPRVPGVNVMVGAAEPGLFNPNQHVAGTDLGNRDFDQAESGGRFGFDEGLHRGSHEGAVISLGYAENPLTGDPCCRRRRSARCRAG